MEKHLLQLIILTTVIHLIDTLAYSVRLNSVKSGQVALSFSLFNVFVLVSRTANVFQAPLIGGLIGLSIKVGLDPMPEVRKVILAATLGTVLGIFLIPTFLRLFSRAVARLEVAGSVPSIVIEALHVNNIKRIARSMRIPSRKMLERVGFRAVPKRLLLLNAVITGFYTIGVLAALYSTRFVAPEFQLAAAGSSGVINGVANILLTLFVDPRSAIITDQALRGERPYGDVKALVILLISTKLLGTLLGQIFFLPAAQVISKVITVFYRG